MTGEITPPQSVPNQFLQQQQQQQQQNPVAQVQEIQQIVSKLPVGAQLVAQITGADKNGNLTVRIAGSELLLSSPIALAKGATLNLRVLNASDNVAFQLISVDGKLPATQAQQVSNFLQNPPSNALFRALGFEGAAQKLVPIPFPTAQAGQAAPVSQQAFAAAAQAVVIGSSGVQTSQGTVLSPAPEAIQQITTALTNGLPADKAQTLLAQLPKNLSAGTKVDFQVTNIQAPAAQAPPSQAGQTAAPTNTNPQAPVDTSNTVLKGQDFQRTQNEQLLRDSGFVPRIATSTEGAPLRLNAQVIALNGNQAVVNTALGRVVIPNQPSSSVVVGSILSLSISNIAAQDGELQQTAIKDLFSQWPALSALQNALIDAGAKDVMSKLAGLDGLFASRMAGFFKAVKENNLDNWLSQDLLRKLTPETQDAIKAKMTGDFASFTRLYNDNQNSGWHTAFMPVFDGKEMHQANFYVKDLLDEEEQNAGQRFVVELTTGGYGEIQLDGLVRKNTSQNRFDLMVRTAEQFPEDVRLGITEIFNTAAEVTGVKGSVEFAKLDGNSLRPADDVLKNQMDHRGISI